jgi:hypothetical protein
MKTTAIIATSLVIMGYATMCASWERFIKKPNFALCPLCGQEVKNIPIENK